MTGNPNADTDSDVKEKYTAGLFDSFKKMCNDEMQAGDLCEQAGGVSWEGSGKTERILSGAG